MTRLNLGCGKVIFPWTAEKEATRHPLLGLPASAYEPDWRNVDALSMPGVDDIVDLFAYPWPWDDNSVDEIWASHLIEHIPHHPKFSFRVGVPLKAERIDFERSRWDCLKTLDGFYAFFAEVWRVLKPGAIIGIAAPYAKCDGALFDPQHTRFIHESTFHYLGNGGNNSPTYDYKIPCSFEAVANPVYRINPPFDQLKPAELDWALSTAWNVAAEIRVDLRAVK